MPVARPLRERLYARLTPCPDPGCECLLWTGSTDSSGYGRISVDGRPVYIHRVAWQLDNEAIPDGMVIDHVEARGCRHKHCGLVAHLEPVSHWVNCLRGPRRSAEERRLAARSRGTFASPQ